MSFKIVPFENKHREAVLNLLSGVFQHKYTDDYLNTGISRKFVLLEDNRVIGFLEYEVLFDDAEIFMIAVHPDFQGKGLGRMLMDFCVKDLQREGVRSVYLDVAVNNTRALEFYRKYGFEVVYTRKEYYKDGTDAYLMKKEI